MTEKLRIYIGEPAVTNSLRSLIPAAVLAISALAVSGTVHAATISASSCAQSAVQSAVGSASNGDIVSVPAGNCSWGSFTISKAIHLRGAGSSSTTITMTGSLTFNKSPAGITRLSDFRFTKSGGGNENRILYVSGAWSDRPMLIHDNIFQVATAGAIRYQQNGGVISRNTFNCQWDESGILHKNDRDQESWASPDTMGTRDSSGERNLYVEDNTFNKCTNQGTDFDDGSRVVFRYNVLNNSSFNSHGLATSPIGVRHFEIYNNQYNYADANVNQNWHIWIRGGTGVMYGNSIQDIRGQQWGDKTEILFSVRAAADGGGGNCCRSYPCPHQVGQNHDGSRQFLDAVRIWSNSGAFRAAVSNNWSNSCGVDPNSFVQEGRDYLLASSAKSGYSAYAYPHPLRSSSPRPAAPTQVRAQ